MQNSQDTIRMSLYQFFGGLLQLTQDKEQTVAIILEELTRISKLDPDDDSSGFYLDMIKPIIKASAYILTINYNKLISDSINAFGEDRNKWPIPVMDGVANELKLIEQLNKYIDKL